MKTIPRDGYLDWLSSWRDRDVIKVITGVRRCGKSTLMDLWGQRLLDSGVPAENIVHINLELLEHEHLLEYHALHDEILTRCNDRGRCYVLIDEVQNVESFEKAIDSLYVRPNIDLYITGSNARLLRGNLSTLLSGRYVEIEVTPLSFAEYIHADASAATRPLRRWHDYLHDGSLPATLSISGNEQLLYDYLSGILNTILLKDVAERLGISGVTNLNAVAAYLFDNIGNPCTAKSIADTLTSNGTKVAPATVSGYIDALCASYLFYPVQRYDLKGKRILKLERKYYAVDTGMRRAMCSGELRDAGRLLENVIYLELRRREKDVYIGKSGSYEIDFITSGPSGRMYFQIAQSVQAPETLERELRSLRSVRDDYPKFLITMDDTRPISHQGIQQVYALDWLLGDY